ncbi:MAG: hypothetical protein HFF14_05795 [Angelakisella sp.]|jgi:hypothetical protein|nr:hypothetical protein [Angelakisella sp.]
MKRKKRDDVYHIRIWRDGILIKQLGPLSRREAAKAWKAWDAREDHGLELLENGVHVRLGRVNKTLEIKQDAFRVAAGEGRRWI